LLAISKKRRGAWGRVGGKGDITNTFRGGKETKGRENRKPHPGGKGGAKTIFQNVTIPSEHGEKKFRKRKMEERRGTK